MPAKKQLKKSLIEHSFYWIDKDTGIPCRVRPDLFNIKDGVVSDFKTFHGLATENEFIKAIGAHDYHIQAAFYLDGINAVLGTNFDTFQCIVAESGGPNEVAVFDIGYMSIEQGRKEYKEYLQILKEHLDQKKVGKKMKTGYEQVVKSVDLPLWRQDIG